MHCKLQVLQGSGSGSVNQSNFINRESEYCITVQAGLLVGCTNRNWCPSVQDEVKLALSVINTAAAATTTTNNIIEIII